MAYLGCKPVAPNLAELLRSTLRRLEQMEDLRPNDPALKEIKSSILRSIAELEVSKEERIPFAA